jgi:hypothetical protein
MRLANSPVLAGVVLLFLAAHFVLLAGILIRIVLTQRRRWLSKNPADRKMLRRSSNRSVSRIDHEETPYEANRMHLL